MIYLMNKILNAQSKGFDKPTILLPWTLEKNSSSSKISLLEKF